MHAWSQTQITCVQCNNVHDGAALRIVSAVSRSEDGGVCSVKERMLRRNPLAAMALHHPSRLLTAASAALLHETAMAARIVTAASNASHSQQDLQVPHSFKDTPACSTLQAGGLWF